MRRDEILQLLRQQPFQPFRLRLSNGIVHEIRHPDMGIVTPSAMVVGVPSQGAAAVDAAENFVIISLVHIVQVEFLTTAPATTA